ncbi:hypothetical protein ACOMHN_036018 [Nucella lapillus]
MCLSCLKLWIVAVFRLVDHNAPRFPDYQYFHVSVKEEKDLEHFPLVLAEEDRMESIQVVLAEEENADLPFMCRNCGKQYKHSATMTRHRKQCEGKYHLSCPVCGRPFHRRDRYQEHLLKMHQLHDTTEAKYRKPRKDSH